MEWKASAANRRERANARPAAASTGDEDGAEGDILDNTPLLDIKPYVPAFDAFEARRIGWCGNAKGGSVAADDRFESGGRG
jgi:hypothetical protein